MSVTGRDGPGLCPMVVGLVVPANPAIGGTTVRPPNVAKLQRERDELLTALKALLENDDLFACDNPSPAWSEIESYRALIARIEKP